MLGEEESDAPAAGQTMMVTPREIDVVVSRAARLLAMSINGALQPAYSPTDLISVARGI